ncbi:MAG: VCBS repeat-containing protein [Chitinophagaceae bacterium]|nr:VCBS repeat-containing protein [Chitinophagaceae bacterium]
MFSDLHHGDTGIDFRNLIVEDESLNVAHYIYFYNGAGVAIGDINNDGLADVFFTGNMVKNRLYLNKGDLEFENITNNSGVAEKQGWCTGTTMVDINHDGFLDIYVCRSADDNAEKRKNLLFVNNGDLTFSEQAEKYGLADNGYSTQATFFDYDKDGDLDCFVLNHSVSMYSTGVTENPDIRNKKLPEYASRLYRNDAGYFRDVSDAAGIISNVLSFGLGVATSDFNNDGWTDIYVSNDFKESDYLFMNNGNGTFTENFAACMDITSLNSMGSDAADYNNDGFTDLVTLDMLSEDNYLQKTHAGSNNFDKTNFLISKGFQPQYMRNMLQKNNGDGTFSEIGQIAGISNTDWSWSALLCDFDGDTKKDLYISNGFVKDFSDLDFVAYSTDKLMKRQQGEEGISFEETIEKMPTIKLSNYMFRNDSAGLFSNVTKQWGLDKLVIASGAAYGDLDNDGDVDLVINNSNDYASVFRNNSRENLKNNFISIKLQGTDENRNGVGAKVKLFCGGQLLMQEQFPARGYQSSVDVVINFGLGKIGVIDSLHITWPDNRMQVLKNVPVNQTLTLKAADANVMTTPAVQKARTLFERIAQTEMSHSENQFNDFTVQPLLLNFLSRQGPCMAKADINRDGREDVFIGGAKGKPAQLFLQNVNGSFNRLRQPSIENDSLSEHTSSVFFDADNDGDVDLFIGSGGFEFSADDAQLQSRLYLNDGKGNFTKSVNTLPEMRISTGCAKAADMDNDGDIDLFIGGRVVPGRYPLTPSSMILANDGRGYFTDVTDQVAPAIRKIGMVTDAVWLDVDKNGSNDLIVVGEWMPITVFLNKSGKFEDASKQYIPFASSGWWNKILADDFDGDGDVDLIIGNAGTNLQFRASVNEPLSLYFKDFDGNGSIDPIFCYYIQGVSYPAASRDDLLEQLPGLKKKFNAYSVYAKATIKDVFSTEQLKDAGVLKAEMLSTVYLQNDGGSFSIKNLPVEAQYSPVHVMQTIDVNGDGKKDVIIAGNNAWTRVRFGRHRSNHGIVLLGDGKGNFTYLPQYESGLDIRGDVRGLEIVNAGNRQKVLFGLNDSQVKMYDVNN